MHVESIYFMFFFTLWKWIKNFKIMMISLQNFSFYITPNPIKLKPGFETFSSLLKEVHKIRIKFVQVFHTLW